VANTTEFQQRVQQLGKLVAELEQMPDSALKVATGELVHLLMEMHGTGIERMMEIIFDSDSAGPQTIDKLGNDPIVRSLLLLYSLHPEDLETRVQKSLDALRPKLRKLNYAVELIDVEEGAVRVRVESSGHACGSTTENVRTMVEEGVYEYAPDVTSLAILGLEEQSSSGFVALESLAGPRVGSRIVHTSALASHVVAVGGAD
jgi:Fe-S cluster biogenesis protein NfuA